MGFSLAELTVSELFDFLLKKYGYQHWWPVTDKRHGVPVYLQRNVLSENQMFEVCVGAILTQNTSWKNVEKSVVLLNENGLLFPEKIAKMNVVELARFIRSSGYFNQKSVYLNGFARAWIERFSDWCEMDTLSLREELLSLKGIGKETADSMLLYAFQRPVFVVDAYTKRLIERLGFNVELDYDSLQLFFEENLDSNVWVFGEFHALIVEHSKAVCRKQPVCKDCFLADKCSYG